jgi:hypothetical protein
LLTQIVNIVTVSIKFFGVFTSGICGNAQLRIDK